MSYPVEVTTLDDKIALNMLTWAKDHCPSYITNVGILTKNDDTVYTFYFAEERDSLAFILRWL
jgi:hypothetical protein